MPWPTAARLVFDVSSQTTSSTSPIDPPPDAEACYISVEDTPARVVFGPGTPNFSNGITIHPGKQPFFLPFAQRIHFEGPERITVLWLKLRYPSEEERKARP
jgi:hypothetical protein